MKSFLSIIPYGGGDEGDVLNFSFTVTERHIRDNLYDSYLVVRMGEDYYNDEYDYFSPAPEFILKYPVIEKNFVIDNQARDIVAGNKDRLRIKTFKVTGQCLIGRRKLMGKEMNSYWRNYRIYPLEWDSLDDDKRLF